MTVNKFVDPPTLIITHIIVAYQYTF